MDIFDWIAHEIDPEVRTSEALLYEHVASQSDRSLPIIYQPFDPENPAHWRDRGAALDFLLAAQCEGKRVLDFGPGDGWPSLILAPRVTEVVGVEGAHRRVQICRENADRLGIRNATFEYVAPGDPLPFADDSFDAVVAASSVEQTPDPRATLRELFRVLKPGGRARLYYEALGRYRGEAEREAWLWPLDAQTTRLMLYDRHIDKAYVDQFCLTYARPEAELLSVLGDGQQVNVAALSAASLASVQSSLIDAGTARTQHPSGPALRDWLLDAGFREAYGTHSAIYVAGRLFDALPANDRPATLAEIDRYLRPIAEVTVALRAPLTWDPMITAVK